MWLVNWNSYTNYLEHSSKKAILPQFGIDYAYQGLLSLMVYDSLKAAPALKVIGYHFYIKRTLACSSLKSTFNRKLQQVVGFYLYSVNKYVCM